MPAQAREFAYALEREPKKGKVKGYFATTSSFSPGCYDPENRGEVVLIDTDQLEDPLSEE